MRLTTNCAIHMSNPCLEFETVTPTNLRNYWYPISFSKHITGKEAKPIGLFLLGDPIVVYRTKINGPVVVLADKCAHRSAPLSVGSFVQKDGERVLECLYHGWQYNKSGKVCFIPALLDDRKIPSNAFAQRYVTVEKYGLVWVWPGDATNAREEDIPPLIPFVENPDLVSTGIDFAMDLNIDHSLMVENLLDPAHLPFTHNGTLSKRSNAQPLFMEVSFDGLLRGSVVMKANQMPAIFEFIPPCTIRLKATIKGDWRMEQVMICVPIRPGHMRLLFRQKRNFFNWAEKIIPGLETYLFAFSRHIVFQDYELLHGQQDRLRQGAKPWNSPIQVDCLPKSYRNWLNKALKEHPCWFSSFDIEDVPSSCNGCDDYIPFQEGVSNDSYYPDKVKDSLRPGYEKRQVIMALWKPLLAAVIIGVLINLIN